MAFSLVQQVIHSKAFPPIRMVHTPETIQGQISIPASNWILMVATTVVVAVFPNLTNCPTSMALQLAVDTVRFSTGVLIAIHIPVVKRLLASFILPVIWFLRCSFLGCFQQGVTWCIGTPTHGRRPSPDNAALSLGQALGGRL